MRKVNKSRGKPSSCASLGGILALAVLTAAPARAERTGDDIWIKAGAYFPKVDTEVSISPPGQEAFTSLIDLESDLDLSDRDVLPQVAIGKRISTHWRVVGEFYKLDRSATKALERDIVFDGVTYPVSAGVESGFNSDVYRLSFGYSFIRKPEFELGAAVGLHATNFEVFIRGDASVGTAAASTEVRRRSLLAPVPTLGLYALAEPVPGLGVAAQVDYLSLKIGDYDGRLLNLQGEVSYAITRNIRIGGMYRYVDYKLDVTKRDWTGRVAYQFSGPAAFLEVGF